MLKPLCLLAGSSSLMLGTMLLTATPAESGSVVIHRVVVGDRTPNVIVIKRGSGWHHHHPEWNHGYSRRHSGYGAVIPGVGSVVTSPWGNSHPTRSPWGHWQQPFSGYAYPSIEQPTFGTPVFVYPSQQHRRRLRRSVTISF